MAGCAFWHDRNLVHFPAKREPVGGKKNRANRMHQMDVALYRVPFIAKALGNGRLAHT
jgi:hypothetical protein